MEDVLYVWSGGCVGCEAVPEGREEHSWEVMRAAHSETGDPTSSHQA